LFHVSWELARRGWHVTLTVRNARGADLYVADDAEAVIHPIQSKALAKRSPVPLGKSLAKLRSPWWALTVNALSEKPTCYIMTLDEVKAGAHRGVSSSGEESFWLQPNDFMKAEYQERWDRLGDPLDVVTRQAAT